MTDQPTDQSAKQPTDQLTDRPGQTGKLHFWKGSHYHNQGTAPARRTEGVSLGKVRLFNIPVKCIVHIILDACGKHKQILMIQGWYYYDLELSRILRNPYSQNSRMKYFFTKQKKIQTSGYLFFIYSYFLVFYKISFDAVWKGRLPFP